MINPFDQFDGANSSASNPFDQFDAPTANKKQNKGITGDLATDLKRGVEQLPGIATGLADIPVAAITGKPLVGQAADTLGGITGFAPSKWAKDAETEYSPGRVAAKSNVNQAWEDNKTPFSDAAGGDFAGIGNIAKSYIQNPQQLVGSVAESLPSMIGGAKVGQAVTKAAGILSPTIAAAGGEGAMMAGQQMDQLSQTDADPRAAAAASALTGIAGGAIGALGGKVASKLGVVDPDIALAGGATRAMAGEPVDQTIKGAAKEGAKRMAGGAISEGLFEELPQSVVEQGLSNFAQNKPIDEGMGRAAIEGTLAGSLMGGAFNALPGSKYVESKTKPPAEGNPEIAGLLPAPTYTGTPGDQLVTNSAERQAAIDAADANAAAVYAARDAFEQQLRQAVTIINEPAPLQQRIDDMLNVDTGKMSKAERTDYEKSLTAAFNEPIGIRHDANQREVPFTIGEYLDAQLAAENAARARPLKQNAGQQSNARIQQVADEETGGYVAPEIPVIGTLSSVANMAVQSGAHKTSVMQQAVAMAPATQTQPAAEERKPLAAQPAQVAAKAPQANAPQAGAQPVAAPAASQSPAIDLSQRTDGQLAYLSQHGKNGHQEAAIAEIQRRGVQVSAAQQAKTDAIALSGNVNSDKPATNSSHVPALNSANSANGQQEEAGIPASTAGGSRSAPAASAKTEDSIGWTRMTTVQREALVAKAGWTGKIRGMNLGGVRIARQAWGDMTEANRAKLIAASQNPIKNEAPAAATVPAETVAPKQEPIKNEDDWLGALFGAAPTAAESASKEVQTNRQAQDKADRVDSAIAMLTGEIEASNAAAAEVAARNYKSNRKQIELKGDGPGKNGSLSISAINESRKRRTVEALQNASSSIKQAIEFIAENPDAAFKQVADMEAAVTKQFNEGFFGPSAKLDGQLDMAVGSLIGSGSYSGEGSAGRKLRMAAHAYASVDAVSQPKTDAAPEAKQGKAPAAATVPAESVAPKQAPIKKDEQPKNASDRLRSGEINVEQFMEATGLTDDDVGTFSSNGARNKADAQAKKESRYHAGIEKISAAIFEAERGLTQGSTAQSRRAYQANVAKYRQAQETLGVIAKRYEHPFKNTLLSKLPPFLESRFGKQWDGIEYGDSAKRAFHGDSYRKWVDLLIGAADNKNGTPISPAVSQPKTDTAPEVRKGVRTIDKWTAEELQARLTRGDERGDLSLESRQKIEAQLDSVNRINAEKNAKEIAKAERVAKMRAANEANKGTFLVGVDKDSAERVSVRNGTVYLGDYPAMDYETEDDIAVPEGATQQQVFDALINGKAVTGNSKIFDKNGPEKSVAERMAELDAERAAMSPAERNAAVAIESAMDAVVAASEQHGIEQSEESALSYIGASNEEIEQYRPVADEYAGTARQDQEGARGVVDGSEGEAGSSDQERDGNAQGQAGAVVTETSGQVDRSQWSITPYRYAKDSVVLKITEPDGFKGRLGRIAGSIGGRYTNRAGGYVMSETKARKIVQMAKGGWDANSFTNELTAPKAAKQSPADLGGQSKKVNASDEINMGGKISPNSAEQSPAVEAGNSSEMDAKKIRAGYAHRSMNLSDKVEMERKWYADALQKVRDKMAPLARNEAQMAELESRMRQFADDYRERRYRVMKVGESAYSAAIAGRSNFNHKQADARGSALDRAEAAFSAWLEAEPNAIKSYLLKLRSAEERQTDAEVAEKKRVKQLVSPVIHDLSTIGAIDAGQMPGMDRSAFTGGAVRKITNLFNAGETEALSQVFAQIAEWDAAHSKPLFTARSPVWKFKAAEQSPAVEAEGNDSDSLSREMAGFTGVSDAEYALRQLSHKEKQEGDIELGNGKFVTLEQAVEAAKKSMDRADWSKPFQFNRILDIAPIDWNTMVGAMKTATVDAKKQEEAKPVAEKAADEKTADSKATADAGEELTYNKRNRRTGGLKWDDIKDKNAALRVKEVVKAKVYPKPDYQALVDGGMRDVVAHIVKQAYDAIAPAPKMKRGAEVSDAALQSYIAGVNRVMDGVMKWANDGTAVAKWANAQSKLSGGSFSISELATAESLLDTVYPGGWKASREEIIMIGGNKMLSALQPGHDEVGRAMKDIKLGWPAKSESWQKQGYKVVNAETVDVELYSSPQRDKRAAYVSGTVTAGNQRIDSFIVRGTADKESQEVQDAIAEKRKQLEGNYVLVDKVGRIEGVYADEEAAIEAAREKVKRESGEIKEVGRKVSEVGREGVEHRLPGDDVTTERLKETFGFRGVNFGNWMKGETNAKTAERQLHLNHLFDAFMDLAQLLNVPPKAMSLNGMLGIAVGAQGSGKAWAHFVPGVNEINVTRTNGAGALAHEWGHALDHYFATMGGMDRNNEPYLSAHVGTLTNRVENGKYVRSPVDLADVRPEVAAQFQSIVEAMTKRKETDAEYAERIRRDVDIAGRMVADEIKKITEDIGQAKGGWGTPSFIAEIRGLAERIAALDYGDGRVSIGSSEVPAVVAEIAEAYKAASGVPLKNAETLGYYADHYRVMSAILESEEGRTPREVNTDYKKASDAADSKKKPYWSTKLEMFARAFDAYVVDSLAEKASSNTYLAGIEAVAPQGDERKTIGKAFDFLFAELKTKETEQGVLLYNQASAGQISPADKAIYGMAAEGKSAAEVLKFIASASRSPFNRQVAKLLLKTGIAPSVTVGDSKTWKISDAKSGEAFAAAYNPKTDTVALFRPASSERNMLHELVHAATIKALSKKGMASAQMKALFAHVEKTGKLNGMYGIRNVDEFIAEAFSNPKFQAMLKQVSAAPVGGKPSSAWDWFIRVVRGILGLKQGADNALSQALDIGVGVMRENMRAATPNTQTGYAGARGSEMRERPSVRAVTGPMAEPAQSKVGAGGKTDAIDISDSVQASAIKAAQKVQDESNAFDLEAEIKSVSENGEADLSSLIANPKYWDAENEEFTDEGYRQVDLLNEQKARDNLRLLSITELSDLDSAYHKAQYAAMVSIFDGMGIPYKDTSSNSSKYLEVGRLKLRFANHANTTRSVMAQVSNMDEVTSLINVAPGEYRFAEALDAVMREMLSAGSDAAPGKINQTDTEAFKRWFGDSKVVDANGEPLVVYHGTASDITAFDIGRSGESTGNTGFYGAGAYFSEDADYASGFSFWARRSDDQAPNVVPVYLSLKNPAYINITPRSQAASEKSRATAEKIISTMIARGTDQAVVDKLQGFVSENKFEPFMGTLYNALGGGTGTTALLKEAGFDGVTIYGGISGKEKLAEAVAFDPTQIKSAIGNYGDFDGSNPDIRYNVADEGWSVSEQAKETVMRLAGRPMLDPSDPFAAENARLREQDQSLWSKAKKQLRRYLAPGGLLPQSVFAEKIKRDSEFQAVEFDVRHLIGGLEHAVKADFGMAFDKLSKEQMRPITEALAGNVPASLPEATKTAAVAMRQYIDGMSTEYLKIIQQKIDAKMLKAIESGRDADKAQAINEIELFEKIKGNIGRYVHRSYQAFDDPKWFEKVPAHVINASRLYLKQGYMEAGETDAKAAQMAEVTLHEILKNGTAYDSMESFIAESKLGAKDLSVLMRRKEVPPQIRALLGEYPDARLNFTKSATKMGRLIWNTRFLDRVRDMGMGSFFFEGKDRPPNATTQIAADGSEVYAPLNGLWTFPETAQAFKDALGKEQMSDLYRAIVRANGLVKYGKTVLAPTTAMRNWQSAMFFSLANGHFDLTQMKKSISAFREQVSQKATGQDLKYLRHLKQLGVVYDTPYAGEMARLMEDARMEELLSSNKGDAVRWFRKANQLAQGFYTFGDDFWKIIGFENEKAGLMKAGLSLQEAEIEAAKRVRDTYPTYSMVGRGVQWLSRFPLAGTFVSFPAEIIRTSGNMLRTVAADLKSDNPKLRELGMKRAAGMVFVSAAFYSLAALSMAMAGVGDDEDEAIRDLAPEWQKNSTFLYLGRDEKGNLRYFDMSFLDPYGYWKRPITAMLRNQPWEDSLASGLRGMLEPFLGADISAKAIFEAVSNAKESGGKVYKENDGAIDQAVDIADHLRKALQPGVVGNVERLVKAAGDVRKPSGQPYSMEDELVALAGWRATTIEPKTALYYRSFEFTDSIAEARKTLTDTLRDANDVSPEDIKDARERAKSKQEQAFKEMSRLVGAAEAAGMSKMQIVQTLRLSNISQANIASLMRGATPDVSITPQLAARAVRQASQMRGPEYAAEVFDRYRQAMAN
jgi:hypothetical protein